MTGHLNRLSLAVGFGVLIVAFLVFLLNGNQAVGIALLALGIVFIVNAGRSKSLTVENRTTVQDTR